MRLIPAIDIIDGKCVRLTQGDYKQKIIYNSDPLDMAKSFEDAGLQYLHLVDLDGAKANHIVNWQVLKKIADATTLKIDFGGGIKSDRDILIAMENGADQVTAGSIAVKDRALFLSWLDTYGTEKIILGADAKEEIILTHGWQEKSKFEVTEFIDTYVNHGISYVICTDISKDGMLEGPAFNLYKKVLKKTSRVKLIASGGVSCVKDLEILRSMGLEGAIIGKAIYEGRISLNELRKLC